MWREVKPLRAEVYRLRAESGQLTIDDATKIFVIGVPPPPDELGRSWKWRFYLPDKHKYFIHFVSSPVPGIGFPAPGTCYSGNSSSLESGEHVCSVSIRKEANGGWQLNSIIQKVLPSGGLDTPGGGTISLNPKDQDWLEGPASFLVRNDGPIAANDGR